MEGLAETINAVYRQDSGRVLARLIRLLGGDFDAAEEALHEAFEAALAQWPEDGVPEVPRAWILRTARNKAIDRIRRRARLAEKLAGEGMGMGEEPMVAAPDDLLGLEEGDLAGEDDRLRLLFTCCNPALAPEAQVALTLRTLSGLTTEEIARAFLVPPATMAQRIVRAKKKIELAKIPYRVPSREELPERLEAVMAVVYLVFTEGYAATAGDALVRRDLCREAIGVARLLEALLPQRPEPKALAALLLLQDSRRETRTDASGEIVVLEEQDRARWDHAQIAEGIRSLDLSLAMGGTGAYVIQAAIAALHAKAARAEDTDWPQIALLYAALARELPSPVVRLNHAVAVAMARGIDAGLELLEGLEEGEGLGGYHLLPAARAELFRRAGRREEAAASYEAALRLVTNDAERRYLKRRLREVG